MLEELPNLNSFTTAEIEINHPEIGSWAIGSQMMLYDPQTGEPKIHHRSYSIPLPFTEPYKIRDVKLPYEMDGEDEFYRMETIFRVEEYQSSGDFYRWERDIQTYYLEVLRYKRKSSTLVWVRPPHLISPPPVTTIPRGPAAPRNMARPIDPRLISHMPTTIELSTGKALGVEFVLSNGIADPPKGSPIATSFNGDMAPIPPMSVGSISVEYPKGVKVSGKVSLYSSDKVYVTTTAYAVKAIFYGEDVAMALPHPYKLIDEGEEEIRVHPPGTLWETRILPPGRPDLPQDFWNNPKQQQQEVVGYSSRGLKGWT